MPMKNPAHPGELIRDNIGGWDYPLAKLPRVWA